MRVTPVSCKHPLNRKTSLLKGYSKRKAAKILASRFIELLPRKSRWRQIFAYLISKLLCNIYQSLDVLGEKSASPELPHRLDRVRPTWKAF